MHLRQHLTDSSVWKRNAVFTNPGPRGPTVLHIYLFGFSNTCNSAHHQTLQKPDSSSHLNQVCLRKEASEACGAGDPEDPNAEPFPNPSH